MEALERQLALHPYADEALKLLALVALSVTAYYLARHFVIRGVAYVAKRTAFQWDDIIVEHGVFTKLAWLAPALVVHNFGHLFPVAGPFMQRFMGAYVLGVLVLAFFDFLNAVNEIYNRNEFARGRPIKGYLQVLKIVSFVFGAIIVLALLLDESPVVLISGLGAMTAVLLLVFKDTILSLVASVQIASNDQLRIGDWIEMPQAMADGDVIDIALHTVKIQNWDKTITAVPTHRFISDSYKNWRGMTESGGRRIKRSIFLDQSSARFLDEALLARLEKIQLLKPYLEERRREIEAWNAEHGVDASSAANGRRMTNVGTFRKYLELYLRAHPLVHKEMTLLVRQLQTGPEGLPIEMYCFSTDQRWAHYEALQADIVDHLLAILPEFELRVFQRPSGADFVTGLGGRKAEPGSAG